jgi:hypothetical protein
MIRTSFLFRVTPRRREVLHGWAFFHFCPDGDGLLHRFGCAVPVGAFADPSFPAPTVSVFDSRRYPWLAAYSDGTPRLKATSGDQLRLVPECSGMSREGATPGYPLPWILIKRGKIAGAPVV